MTGSGILKSTLFDHMSTFTKLINTLPEELAEAQVFGDSLYPNIANLRISYDQPSSCLTETDNEAYNVVILGPTGSGKSTIINNIFNRYVCETGATAQSVTKEVKFLQGRISVRTRNNNTGQQRQTVKKLNAHCSEWQYFFQK